MLRKILLAGFVLIVGILLYNIAVLYFGYKNLSDVPASHVLGNPEGDLSVVEFLDYNCPYCREAHPTITQAVQQDGNIKYIVRPVAFFGEDSLSAVKALYAAAQQGYFAQMHNALMQPQNVPDNEQILQIARDLGLDVEKFTADLESETTLDPLSENYKTFAQIGAKATPTFVIGHRLQYVPEGRMPTVDDFLDMFNQARSAGLK